MERREFLKGVASFFAGAGVLAGGRLLLPETAELDDGPVTPAELHATEKLMIEYFEESKAAYETGKVGKRFFIKPPWGE